MVPYSLDIDALKSLKDTESEAAILSKMPKPTLTSKNKTIMIIVKTGIKKSFLSVVTSSLVCIYSTIAKTPATTNITQPITP